MLDKLYEKYLNWRIKNLELEIEYLKSIGPIRSKMYDDASHFGSAKDFDRINTENAKIWDEKRRLPEKRDNLTNKLNNISCISKAN